MAIPFAHAWMKHHKNKRRIVVIDPSLKEVMERCRFPADIWSYSKLERPKLVIRLQEEKPSSVTMMTNSWGSIMPYWKADVPQRIGYGGSATRWLLNDRGPRSQLSRPQGERWFACACRRLWARRTLGQVRCGGERPTRGRRSRRPSRVCDRSLEPLAFAAAAR